MSLWSAAATAAEDCLYLKHSFTCLISGPTGCGKTEWLRRLLMHNRHLLQPPPEKILWCYGQYQPLLFQALQPLNIAFTPGLPDNLVEDWAIDPSRRKLIILDDLMQQSAQDKRVTRLFVQGSHHQNISVICILQNMYFQGPQMRTISLNTHYMVVFKNPRVRQQVLHLSRQMYPHDPKVLEQAFMDATKAPYGYLFLNLKPETPEACRLLTNIFGGQGPPVAYVPCRIR